MNQDVRLSSPRGRGVVLATVAGSSVAMLDGTVVNIALPHIGDDLGAGISGLQWIVTGYTLLLASLVLVGGALGDRYGRRAVFLLGVVWFGVASMLCGVAVDSGTLITARVLQGIGAGLLTPGSLAIIQSTLTERDRARAIGTWSGLGGVATAIGPFLGGWLVDALSWRWVFFINIPIVIIAVVAALRYVPESRGSGTAGRFDLSGSVLAALFLGGISYALVQHDPPTPARIAAVVGVACGIAFIVVEYRGSNPLMPPRMFANRQFSGINLVTFCCYAGLGGLMFFLVMQLQIVSGYSALRAGISMLPFTILMLAFSARAGALGDRLGPRLPLAAGCTLSMIGVLMLTFMVGREAPYWSDVLPGVLVLSVGMTTVVAPLTAGVLAATDSDRAGVASGINNAIARAASLLAVAALPVVAGLNGSAYTNPKIFSGAYLMAMLCCAGLFALGAILSATLVKGRTKPKVRPAVHTQCAVTAPTLDTGTK